jgi:hypothetical protein
MDSHAEGPGKMVNGNNVKQYWAEKIAVAGEASHNQSRPLGLVNKASFA